MGFSSANALRVSLHHFQAGAHIRSEINFVDDQKSGVGDARPAFSRNFVALGHVDHVNRGVHQFRTERCGQVVSAALNQQKVKLGKAAHQDAAGLEVDGGIFADRRMRASARLDADDPLRGERLATHQEVGILARVDIVGNDGDVACWPKARAERLHQGGLARAHGPADSDFERFGNHDRNNLASSMAWRMAAISMAGAKLQMSAMSLP